MIDCGPMATVIESHGPPTNRVNYIIVGDGYSATELTSTLITHVNNYMTRRFSEPIGVPYKRYRNFFNICVLQVPSTPICGSSAFGCCGDDSSRLANCNDSKVNAAIKQYIPAAIPVDFKAVVLNGSSWWNSGGMLMYWSGGNKDAPGAAMHEGEPRLPPARRRIRRLHGRACGPTPTSADRTAPCTPRSTPPATRPPPTASGSSGWAITRRSRPAGGAPGRGSRYVGPGSTGRRRTRR